jgi:hypothetical protein
MGISVYLNVGTHCTEAVDEDTGESTCKYALEKYPGWVFLGTLSRSYDGSEHPGHRVVFRHLNDYFAAGYQDHKKILELMRQLEFEDFRHDWNVYFQYRTTPVGGGSTELAILDPDTPEEKSRVEYDDTFYLEESSRFNSECTCQDWTEEEIFEHVIDPIIAEYNATASREGKYQLLMDTGFTGIDGDTDEDDCILPNQIDRRFFSVCDNNEDDRETLLRLAKEDGLTELYPCVVDEWVGADQDVLADDDFFPPGPGEESYDDEDVEDEEDEENEGIVNGDKAKKILKDMAIYLGVDDEDEDED